MPTVKPKELIHKGSSLVNVFSISLICTWVREEVTALRLHHLYSTQSGCLPKVMSPHCLWISSAEAKDRGGHVMGKSQNVSPFFQRNKPNSALHNNT
jgi:hypothetical protein